jgi:hypothetical protein
MHYISESTEWINLKFGGVYRVSIQVCACKKLWRYVTMHGGYDDTHRKFKKLDTKTGFLEKIFPSQARLNIERHLDVVYSSY